MVRLNAAVKPVTVGSRNALAPLRGRSYEAPRLLRADEATSARWTRPPRWASCRAFRKWRREATGPRCISQIRHTVCAHKPDTFRSQPQSVLVAHRQSTVRSCDLIVVMENGVIVEQGTHEQTRC